MSCHLTHLLERGKLRVSISCTYIHTSVLYISLYYVLDFCFHVCVYSCDLHGRIRSEDEKRKSPGLVQSHHGTSPPALLWQDWYSQYWLLTASLSVPKWSLFSPVPFFCLSLPLQETCHGRKDAKTTASPTRAPISCTCAHAVTYSRMHSWPVAPQVCPQVSKKHAGPIYIGIAGLLWSFFSKPI